MCRLWTSLSITVFSHLIFSWHYDRILHHHISFESHNNIWTDVHPVCADVSLWWGCRTSFNALASACIGDHRHFWHWSTYSSNCRPILPFWLAVKEKNRIEEGKEEHFLTQFSFAIKFVSLTFFVLGIFISFSSFFRWCEWTLSPRQFTDNSFLSF